MHHLAKLRPHLQADILVVQAIAAALSQAEPAELVAFSQPVIGRLLQPALQAAQAFAEAPQPLTVRDRAQHAASQAVLRGLQRIKALLTESTSFAAQAAAAAAVAAQQPSLGQLAIQVHHKMLCMPWSSVMVSHLNVRCADTQQPVAWRGQA